MTYLEVHVNRDSVAAGDDCDPHDTTISVPHSPNLLVLLSHILTAYPLPQIQGGNACWIISCTSNFGTPFPYNAIAVGAQQWNLPQLLVPPETAHYLDADASMTLYFKYLRQKSPEAVMDALQLLGGR